MDVQMVESKVRHAVLYVPAGTAIPNGPCDFVMVDTDLATITAELEEDTGAPITVPLAAGIWHPMCCTKLTASTSANVWVGWLKVPQANKG